MSNFYNPSLIYLLSNSYIYLDVRGKRSLSLSRLMFDLSIVQ
ncbi:hypothetical protein [Okeania sp. SIO2B3]|nr:hypothetical protein [Okeania sp. SIO2B3]